ncbi:MAG: transcriptional repressor [Acidobacteria bacterium]|nr:transcriptional repressor [Acidobacteriota bacterium]
MRSPVELTHAFRRQGLKLTRQRQVLFDLLHENGTHPTAEALHAAAAQRVPGISLRTVYQTLNDLTAMGELHAISLAPGAVRFDPNTDAHHHAQCDRCGALHDVYVEDLPPLRTRGLDGFRTEGTTIVFRGLCDACVAHAADVETASHNTHNHKEPTP